MPTPLDFYDIDNRAALFDCDLDGSYPDSKRVSIAERPTGSKFEKAGRLYLLDVSS